MNKKREENGLIDEIKSAIQSIRYGYVQIIIQDSKVVQIDKTEKIRLDKPKERGLENNVLSTENTKLTNIKL